MKNNSAIQVNEEQREAIVSLLNEPSDAITGQAMKDWVKDSEFSTEATPSKLQTLELALGEEGLQASEIAFTNKLHQVLHLKGLLERTESDGAFTPEGGSFAMNPIPFQKLEQYSRQLTTLGRFISDIPLVDPVPENKAQSVLSAFSLTPATFGVVKACLEQLSEDADLLSKKDWNSATSKEGDTASRMHVTAHASEPLTERMKADLIAGVTESDYDAPLLGNEVYNQKLRAFQIKLSARADEPLEGEALEQAVDRYASSVISKAVERANRHLGADETVQFDTRQKQFYERSQRRYTEAQTFAEAAETLESVAGILGIQTNIAPPSPKRHL